MNNQIGGYIRSDGRVIYAGKISGDFEQPGPKAEALLWNYLVDQKKLNIDTISDYNDHKTKQTNYIQWLGTFTEMDKPGTSFFNEPLGVIIPHIVSDKQAYILLKNVVSKRNQSDTTSIKKITKLKSETGHTLSWLNTEFYKYDGRGISRDQEIKDAHEAYKIYATTKRWSKPSFEDFVNSWNHYSHKQFTQNFINILKHVDKELSKTTTLSSKKDKSNVPTSIVKSPNTLLREAENNEEVREQEQIKQANLKLTDLGKDKKKLQKTLKQIEIIEKKLASGVKINQDQIEKINKKDSINSQLIIVDKEITDIYSSFPQLDSKRSRSSSNSKSDSSTKPTSISSGKTRKNSKSRSKKKRKNTHKKYIK